MSITLVNRGGRPAVVSGTIASWPEALHSGMTHLSSGASAPIDAPCIPDIGSWLVCRSLLGTRASDAAPTLASVAIFPEARRVAAWN